MGNGWLVGLACLEGLPTFTVAFLALVPRPAACTGPLQQVVAPTLAAGMYFVGYSTIYVHALFYAQWTTCIGKNP